MLKYEKILMASVIFENQLNLSRLTLIIINDLINMFADTAKAEQIEILRYFIYYINIKFSIILNIRIKVFHFLKNSQFLFDSPSDRKYVTLACNKIRDSMRRC